MAKKRATKKATTKKPRKTPQQREIERLEKDPLLSYSQCAKLCSKTSQTIRNWVAGGLLKPERIPNGRGGVRPIGIRLSTFKKFLSGASIDYSEYEPDAVETNGR